jgi:Domain of unknown function (DUF5615)
MTPVVRFLVDEDFDNDIVRGVLRRLHTVDMVRVQDVGLSGRPDSEVLRWAADENRVVLTHDVSTMKTHAFARVAAGQPMPGVFAASQFLPIGQVIETILLIAVCSLVGEWEGQVRHLPL